MSTSLTIIPPQELMRQSTDIAGLCRAIVVATAMKIGGKQYVKVEGWQSIATAHGCIASARDVKKIEGGIVAIGELRRMNDAAVLATAEGFVGDDETTWSARAEYARRAMAQTRAISRVCRSAFAHVVVLMDAGLSTTPAEEVPEGGFNNEPAPVKQAAPQQQSPTEYPDAVIELVKTPQDGKWKDKLFFITFAGIGEAGTFDKSIAKFAEECLAKKVKVNVKIQPNTRKPGSFEIVTIEAADDIPM